MLLSWFNDVKCRLLLLQGKRAKLASVTGELEKSPDVHHRPRIDVSAADFNLETVSYSVAHPTGAASHPPHISKDYGVHCQSHIDKATLPESRAHILPGNDTLCFFCCAGTEISQLRSFKLGKTGLSSQCPMNHSIQV